MRVAEWASIVVLVIAGLYFLVFHVDPFPLNHESIGLGEFGKMHIVHNAIGVVLIGVAGLIGWRSRRAARTRTTM